MQRMTSIMSITQGKPPFLCLAKQHSRVLYQSVVLGLLLLCGGLLTSCVPQDPRDICCSKVTLEYRYVRQSVDEYPTEVQQMRHFLYDAHGTLLREIPQSTATPQTLSLSGLPVGRYTILTVGNATEEHTLLDPLARGSKLSDMTLTLRKLADGSYAPQGDQLFWNYKTIDIQPGANDHYICDLANIHTHLYYSVIWESVPPYADGYSVRLSELTEQYSLDPAKSNLHLPINAEMQVTHDFPLHAPQLIQLEEQPKLFNHTLEGSFISLRYLNDRIPTIQVWHGDEAITKPIDLTRAFRSFGWIPDQRPEQIYRILLRINDDGSVTLFPYFKGTIADWVPGGTVTQ